MPFVNIKITRDGATPEQKAELIKGVTDLLVKVLHKNPATTVVVIDEVETDNWGIGGETVTSRRRERTSRVRFTHQKVASETRLTAAQARRLCHQVFSWRCGSMAFQRKSDYNGLDNPDASNVTNRIFNILIFWFILTEN